MPLNKQKWMFDLAVLQKGDVLFTRSKFVGTGIAKATNGHFGHVMLYLENMIIHADTKGVWSKNPQRILINDPSRLAVYRLNTPLSADHLKRVESYARRRVGSLYSIPQAIQSLQTRQGKFIERYLLDKQFCSRLVAQSFAEVGINLVADFDYCTPNEIAESALLREVPHAVRAACPEDLAFYKTPDYNLELQVEAYKWLNQVRTLAEKHQLRPVHAQSDVGQWIIDHPKFDAEICGYIQSTKYLTFYDADERKNPWRYHPQLMLKAIVASPSAKAALAFESNQNALLLKQVQNERLIAIQNTRLGLGYFRLEEQLQTNRFAQLILWRNAIDYASQVINQHTLNE